MPLQLRQAVIHLRERDKNLTKVDLSYQTFSNKELQSLSLALAKNNSVQELHLNSCQLDEEKFKYLKTTLAEHKSLRILSLAGNCFKYASSEIADMLAQNNRLLHLNLWDCEIGDFGAELLWDTLGKNKSLVTLDLENNEIREPTLKKITVRLEKHHQDSGQLKKAVCEGNLIEVKQWVNSGVSLLSLTGEQQNTPLHWAVIYYQQTIAEYLIHEMRKQGLTLSLRNQDNKKAADFAKIPSMLALFSQRNLAGKTAGLKVDTFESVLEIVERNHKSYDALDLSYWEITGSRMPELLFPLRRNRRLKTLNLSGNEIGLSSAKSLEKIIEYNKSLMTLILDRNYLSDRAVELFFCGLLSNVTLLELSLQNNGIGDDGAAFIIRVLKKQKAILTINLDGNSISEESLSEISQYLRRNHELRNELHAAARCGSLPDVERLVAAGVSLLAVSGKQENTALHWAILHRQQAVAAYLIEYMQINKLSLTQRNKEGKTAADLAKSTIAEMTTYVQTNYQRALTPPFYVLSGSAYKNEDAKQLSFAQGTVLYVYAMVSMYWYWGVLEGKAGYIPRDRVYYIDPPPILQKEADVELELTIDKEQEEQYFEKVNARIRLAFAQLKEEYLHLGRVEFESLQRSFVDGGWKKFEALLQERAHNFALAYEEKHQQLLVKVDQQYKDSYEEKLNKALAVANQGGSLSADTLSQLVNQVHQQLDEQWSESFKKAFTSAEYQEQTSALQQQVLLRIEEQQKELSRELVYVQTEQTQLSQAQDITQKRLDPIYQKHQRKQQILAERQDLQDPQSVRIFYNTIQNQLATNLLGTLSLSSGLIERITQTSDKAGKFSAKMVSGLLNGIPVVGGVLGALADFSIEEGSQSVKDKQQKQRAEAVRDSFINLDDAMDFAELVARRFAQYYRQKIQAGYYTDEIVREAAVSISDRVAEYLNDGRFIALSGKNSEVKIQVLLQVFAADTGKTLFSEKSPLSKSGKGTPLSPATQRQIEENLKETQRLNENVETMKAMMQYGKFAPNNASAQRTPPKRLRLEEVVKGEASFNHAMDRIKKTCPVFTEEGFQLRLHGQDDQYLYFDIPESNLMREIGRAYKDTFADIETVAAKKVGDKRVLAIKCQDGFACDDLRDFLQQANWLADDNLEEQFNNRNVL